MAERDAWMNSGSPHKPEIGTEPDCTSSAVSLYDERDLLGNYICFYGTTPDGDWGYLGDYTRCTFDGLDWTCGTWANAVKSYWADMGLTRSSGQLDCATNSGSALCSYASVLSKGNFSVLSKPRG
jgi:hypothetical protein